MKGVVLVPYPQAFLDLQIIFARKMAALGGEPVAKAVLRNTALYRILGLDWSLDPGDPAWRRFVAALGPDGTETSAAYAVYAERYAQGLIPDYDTSRPHWGCFSYEYDDKAIRLHFADLDTSRLGPLSSARGAARLADLRALFADTRERHPEAEIVRGGTWLYNRAEYRRLFPPEYGDSARADHPHLIRARAVGAVPAPRQPPERRDRRAIPLPRRRAHRSRRVRQLLSPSIAANRGADPPLLCVLWAGCVVARLSQSGGAGEATGAPPTAIEDAILLALPERERLPQRQRLRADHLQHGIEQPGGLPRRE